MSRFYIVQMSGTTFRRWEGSPQSIIDDTVSCQRTEAFFLESIVHEMAHVAVENPVRALCGDGLSPQEVADFCLDISDDRDVRDLNEMRTSACTAVVMSDVTTVDWTRQCWATGNASKMGSKGDTPLAGFMSMMRSRRVQTAADGLLDLLLREDVIDVKRPPPSSMKQATMKEATMKKSSIEVGKTYTNGKGKFRVVTAKGSKYKLYRAQEEPDCLEYQEVKTLKSGLQATINTYYQRGFHQSELHHHITRKSFASWAKREATVEETREMKICLANAGGRS